MDEIAIVNKMVARDVRLCVLFCLAQVDHDNRRIFQKLFEFFRFNNDRELSHCMACIGVTCVETLPGSSTVSFISVSSVSG